MQREIQDERDLDRGLWLASEAAVGELRKLYALEGRPISRKASRLTTSTVESQRHPQLLESPRARGGQYTSFSCSNERGWRCERSPGAVSGSGM
jgi:hypothetical protein